MRSTDKMALALTLAMLLGSATLLELTADRGFLLLAAPVIILLMAISALSRRFRAHPVLVHLWQVLALAGAIVGLGVNAVPGPGNIVTQLREALYQGVLHIQTQSAPMEPNAGTSVILVALVGIVTIIADVLVLSLESPTWVAAPLLTLYLIPALALPHQVHWWSFLLLGAAFLIVLAADTATQLGSWTRHLVSDNAKRDHTSAGVWTMATMLGAPVLALALVAGNVLPTFGSLDLQSRRPRGGGPIQMQDPTIQLHRNLAQQSNEVVLTYTSDAPEGQYLRMASLSVMERDSWKLTAVSLEDGDISSPPGLTAPEVTSRTNISVREFGSQYLPVPYAPSVLRAPGQWSHDPVTLMILSTAQNNADATRNISYEVTSLSTDPDPDAFNQAQVGSPPDSTVTTTVPSDLPKEIIDLTSQVTADAPTPVLKAAAIQAWLRDPRRFTYSTDAPPGDGFDVMRNFLLEERQGYCIHFASAMAMMARISGIPSRVAVGFLPGTRNGDTWEVRGKDMHAWPELYFQGYGWVRFEPTAGVADAPAWTVVRDVTQPSPSASPSDSTEPSESGSTEVGPTESAPTMTETQTQVETEAGTGTNGRRTVTIVGVGLAALALLLTPMLVRSQRRRRRFAGRGAASDQVEDLWSELRDTLRDNGVRWPAGSPREKAATLGAKVSDRSGAALATVAEVVEQSRYSRGLDSVPEGLGKEVRYVVDDVSTKQSFGTKLRAKLWPSSVFTNLFGSS